MVKQTKMISNKCELLFASFEVSPELTDEPNALLIVKFNQPSVEFACSVATLETQFEFLLDEVNLISTNFETLLGLQVNLSSSKLSLKLLEKP